MNYASTTAVGISKSNYYFIQRRKKHRYLLVLIMRYKLSYGAGLGSGKKHLHIKLFLQGSATNSTIPISL